MSYSSIVNSSKEKVIQHAIATKILDLMDKLRMDENNNSKRRWIWELLQNAKDVRYPGHPIQIQIGFSHTNNKGYVTFKHNGQPFSVDNLNFLIEQVSTKERTDSKEAIQTKAAPTGRFGTGFLTTHLLSEIVFIESYLKEPDLPYKPFSLQLDRSPRSLPELIKSIDESMRILNTIEAIPPVTDYDVQQLNTSFKYQLDKEGIEVAEIGLKDLTTALPYTLLFLPQISSVELASKGAICSITATLFDQDDIKIQKIVNDSNADGYEITIATISSERALVAVPVSIAADGTITLLPLPDSLPKLHCDFPLIGSEDFCIPFVINSSYFNPNEPRDGIFLSDKTDARIEENKSIIKEAIQSFEKLVNYASDASWKDLYNFAAIGDAATKSWLSKSYYKEQIQKPVQQLLEQIPLVDTLSGGRKSIVNGEGKYQVWFPAAANKEVLDKLWTLCSKWNPSVIPIYAHAAEWYNIWWKEANEITLAKLGKYIHDRKSLEELKKNLPEGSQPLSWLNEYYELVNLEGKYIDEIIANRVAVIPNQHGHFKTREKLYFDDNIDEALKDILADLGDDIRDQLRDRNIETYNKRTSDAKANIEHGTRDTDHVSGRINKILAKGQHNNLLKAALGLTALLPKEETEAAKRTAFYTLVQRLFGAQLPDRKTILHGEDQWAESDRIVVYHAAKAIAETASIEQFTIQYEFPSNKDALKWLDHFITTIAQMGYDAYLNDAGTAILPNQDGDFMVKDAVFLDDGSIDKSLKDICELLDDPIRSELLDVNIFLELAENRTLSQEQIADRITILIYPHFASTSHNDNVKSAFRLMAIWFQKHKVVAESLFTDLYRGRHKLYDDDEVVSNMQAAEDLKQLMQRYDISDIGELENRLKALGNQESTPEPEAVTAETLASLGIGSVEEFEEAMKDIDLKERFSHVSTPNFEMFQHAQSLIKRAKMNILDFLKTVPQYDCSQVEEVARTVLGGILYEGRPIHLVCRPSDNGEVIVYYSSEKDTLELPESQLWIEDGIRTPKQLTLGRILKDTGINRIPVKYE